MVTLLHLLNDFKWTVFFAKYPVVPLPVDALDLEEVVGPPGTFDVKRNHALRVLALNTRPAILAATDYALKVEALEVDFRHPHRCLGRHDRPWDPHGATQVNPFVESLSARNRCFVKPLSVALQKESIVFRDLCNKLRLKEMQLYLILRKHLLSLFRLCD